MSESALFGLSGGSVAHPLPQPPYPALTLLSTLADVLNYSCDRSATLDDALVVVEYMTPFDIRVSWPAAADQAKAQSVISIHISGRPAGGARIGIWQSEGGQMES